MRIALLRVLLGVVASAFAGLSIIAGDVNRPIFFGLVFTLVLVATAWDWYGRRRAQRYLAALQAVAGRTPTAVDGMPGPQAAAAVTAGRSWQLLTHGAAAVAVVGALALVDVVAPHLSSDCRTARAVIGYISDHRDIFTTNPTAGPALSDYQRWADQLQRFADNVSEPDVAPHMHTIAYQAAHAVGLLSLARTMARLDPAGEESPSQTGIAAGFTTNLNQIVDEENTLLDSCHMR